MLPHFLSSQESVFKRENPLYPWIPLFTASWSEACYTWNIQGLIFFFGMNVVSRYIQQPHDIHWKVAKRNILQYIHGTRSYVIHYAADSELELVDFTDSDWAGNSIDQKSTSGYVFMFGGGPIF